MSPLRIGLTGGIGSGKSTVGAMFVALGATLIDTDAISRELTATGGAAVDDIRRAFGSEFIDAFGAVVRPKMREAVFGDRTARQRLEAILHPLIGAETERRAAQAATEVIVFDVPLLVESGRWRERVDRVVVVDCGEAAQIERVSARPGWTRDIALSVIAQQASRAERRACADAIVFNEGKTLDALGDDVKALWNNLRVVATTAHAGTPHTEPRQ